MQEREILATQEQLKKEEMEEEVAGGEENGKEKSEVSEGEMSTTKLDEFNAAYAQIEKRLRRDLGLPEAGE